MKYGIIIDQLNAYDTVKKNTHFSRFLSDPAEIKTLKNLVRNQNPHSELTQDKLFVFVKTLLEIEHRSGSSSSLKFFNSQPLKKEFGFDNYLTVQSLFKQGKLTARAFNQIMNEKKNHLTQEVEPQKKSYRKKLPRLSGYKLAVLEKLQDYINEIEHPDPVRETIGTNPERLKAVKAIINRIGNHDVVFLSEVLSQAMNIKDISSQFRDEVGKEALVQGLHYLAGGIELSVLSVAILELANGKGSRAFFCAALCFFTDQTENYLQSIVKKHNLQNAIDTSVHAVSKTKLYDAFITKIKEVSLEMLLSSARRINDNVYHFAHSHFILFSNMFTKNSQPLNEAQEYRFQLK